ncbi:MAG TPA: FAD-linked oxidase C-terminal domain-containing protein, partial [Bacteroidales bacterium]|nr:FAD-linked oxidase C-terminal domain-containing protein [Bacteroidales bacterium]
ISVGELHLRPILNLKDSCDVVLFHTIAEETARLVKKYRGSLSGEHGDGRLRGEFIPLMVGDDIYQWFRDIKNVWDPQHIFNAGKITDTPPMNKFLRYEPGKEDRRIETIFDFSSTGGILRAAEKCNGTGDCRKTELIGGTMCPSYMATRDENTTTRARANILREFLTHSSKENPFDHKEIYDVLDLCLSCKGCKSECPSNVDMAKLKAEFLQHYYDSNGIPLRTRMIAYITSFNKIGSLLPTVYNFFLANHFTSTLFKQVTGFARERSIPLLYKQPFRRWAARNLKKLNDSLPEGAVTVNLFVDEFTEYNDTEIGIKAVKLLTSLGYRVRMPRHGVSARTFISKGLLRTARQKAIHNIIALREHVSEETPLIGIEPSGILGFRDEYPELVNNMLKADAMKIAENSLMIDEFLARETDAGRITKDMFTSDKREIKLHGHCQQKAIASTSDTLKILSIPENYSVTEIPSGCCGMAGSFGYEKEHYELSVKVGELVLFPAIRKAGDDVTISAPGTSCRHQIKDGTGRKALHPMEVLYDALINK